MTDHSESFRARGMSPTEPIEKAVDISASAADVWSAISERGNLTNVHPFCATNEVETWPGGPGGRDHVHYYSGVHYQRDVLEWTDSVGYDLMVGPPGAAIAVARWRIAPTAGNECRFGIEVTSFARDEVTPEARARYVSEVIEGAIPPYLDSVVKGVAHFAETGDPVARNQFGPHPIYSPPAG